MIRIPLPNQSCTVNCIRKLRPRARGFSVSKRFPLEGLPGVSVGDTEHQDSALAEKRSKAFVGQADHFGSEVEAPGTGCVRTWRRACGNCRRR